MPHLSFRHLSVLVFLLALAACESGTYATIGAPEDGARFRAGDEIVFHAEVNSNEPLGISTDGDWIWMSDRDGRLGDTPLFIRTDLSPGRHRITLRVENSRAVPLRDKVTIVIR